MKDLNKESLADFLKERPALSKTALSREAGLNESYIRQLYNVRKTELTEKAKVKLMPILEKYGW